ncbi:MAG: NUDIX hydrolase [Christensenellaceae bacterium]
MDLTEKRIDGQTLYKGCVFEVQKDTVQLPNKKISVREVVRHNGGACVCAMDSEYNVFFVRQFRYAYNKEILEMPAGKLEKDEDAYSAAVRELREETGIAACDMISLGEMYPSVGYTDEVISMYLAVNLTQSEQQLDEDEFVKIEKIPFEQAMQMVLTGEIKDAKTQICLLKAYLMLDALGREQTAKKEI